MEKKEFIAVAVRLFALVLAIYALTSIPQIHFYFNNDKYQGSALVFIGIYFFLLVIAAVLWKFPLTAASRILPGNQPQEQITNWNTQEILMAGMVLIGFYFLLVSIHDSIYWLYIWIYSNTAYDMEIELNANEKARIISIAVKFVLSIALVFGARGLSNLIYKLRTAGHN